MSYEIVWTENALAHLANLLAYFEEVYPPAVKKYLQAIKQFEAIVAQMPEIAQPYALMPKYCCWSGMYPYKIFYRVSHEEGLVFIVALHHGKQREPNFL